MADAVSDTEATAAPIAPAATAHNNAAGSSEPANIVASTSGHRSHLTKRSGKLWKLLLPRPQQTHAVSNKEAIDVRVVCDYLLVDTTY